MVPLEALAHQWLRVNCGALPLTMLADTAAAENAGVFGGDISSGIVTGDMGREGDACSFFEIPLGADLAYT